MPLILVSKWISIPVTYIKEKLYKSTHSILSEISEMTDCMIKRQNQTVFHFFYHDVILIYWLFHSLLFRSFLFDIPFYKSDTIFERRRLEVTIHLSDEREIHVRRGEIWSKVTLKNDDNDISSFLFNALQRLRQLVKWQTSCVKTIRCIRYASQQHDMT